MSLVVPFDRLHISLKSLWQFYLLEYPLCTQSYLVFSHLQYCLKSPLALRPRSPPGRKMALEYNLSSFGGRKHGPETSLSSRQFHEFDEAARCFSLPWDAVTGSFGSLGVRHVHRDQVCGQKEICNKSDCAYFFFARWYIQTSPKLGAKEIVSLPMWLFFSFLKRQEAETMMD